jgi:hypothetical protein
MNARGRTGWRRRYARSFDLAYLENRGLLSVGAIAPGVAQMPAAGRAELDDDEQERRRFGDRSRANACGRGRSQFRRQLVGRDGAHAAG